MAGRSVLKSYTIVVIVAAPLISPFLSITASFHSGRMIRQETIVRLLLRKQRGGASLHGKVHGTPSIIGAFLIFQRHVLRQDTSYLFSHIFARLLVVPVSDTSERGDDHENRESKCVCRDLSRRRASGASGWANATCHTHDGISACRALVANTGFGSFGVSCTDGVEHSSWRKLSSNGCGIDKGSGQDDDAAFLLCRNFQIKECIGSILFEASTVTHASVNFVGVHFRMLVAVHNAVFVHEVIGCVAAIHKLLDIIPPNFTNSVLFPIVVPDAQATEGFLNNVCTRDSLIQVVIGVSGTVSSVVGAQVITKVFSIVSLAVGLDSVVNVHVRSKVGTITKRLGQRLEV
mmetsp:Transcript_1776/g.3153  ORF Transcript_1776/g.3153 Transcript_1776/m.3153 type:complete len:347 (-) Transcript_1776:727-1767(-)